MQTRWLYAFIITAVSAACASAPPPVKAPPRPAMRKPPPHVPTVEGTYWEAVHPELPEEPPVAAPLDRETLARAFTAFGSIPEETAISLREEGIARTRGGARSMAAWHTHRPSGATLVTADTLFFVARAAASHAMAEVNDRVTRPALTRIIATLGSVLAKESAKPRSDLILPYAMARSIVAVADRLLNADGVTPPELAPGVDAEVRAIREHRGVLGSPILGVLIDYSVFANAGDADTSPLDVGERAALLYLSHAPLMLASRGEGGPAKVLPQTARAHARAALILSRAVDEHVNPTVGADYDAVVKLLRFAFGVGDDAWLDDVQRVASALGYLPEDLATASNTVAVDRIRRAAATAQRPHIFDGAGAKRARAKAPVGENDLLAPPTVRVFGASTSADGGFLQSIVFPNVGAHPDHGPRRLPSALDVGAWLGSEEALTRVQDRGFLGYDGYETVLLRERKRSELEAPLHASAYATWLDALATYARPSIGDERVPASKGRAWGKQKLETILAAWVEGRHDATPLGRRGVSLESGKPPKPDANDETRATTFTVRVEPHPEAIAKLVGYVRQVRTGLAAHSAKQSTELVLAEEWLTAALHAAEREARGESPTAENEATLREMTSALARIGESAPAADDAIATRLHSDATKGESLVGGAGATDTVYLILREADADVLLLAGPSRSFYEWVQPSHNDSDDGTWRIRLSAPIPPKPKLERVE